jgi:protein subunit release factor A
MLTYHDYAEMARSSLDEIARDCETDVFHAHGPGGQGVNTTDSAVRMRHLPTGIVVVSRESRSQYRNRQLCLQKIQAELQRRSIPPTKRVKTKPTKGSQRRRLKAKRERSEIKQSRRRITGDE